MVFTGGVVVTIHISRMNSFGVSVLVSNRGIWLCIANRGEEVLELLKSVVGTESASEEWFFSPRSFPPAVSWYSSGGIGVGLELVRS